MPDRRRKKYKLKPTAAQKFGARIVRHAELVANAEDLIASARRRLSTVKQEELDTIGRILKSLQATLDMHFTELERLWQEWKEKRLDPPSTS